jgi:ribosome maturation factor RimP
MNDDLLERELEGRVEALGLEFVELERAGSRARPILRVRIDRPGSDVGSGVTVDDCTRVSRALESYLDGAEGLSDRYVLEVSSPGVERPLLRRRDFERFTGRDIVVKGHAPLAGRKEKRLEGELVALDGEGEQEHITLRLADGSNVEIPRADIARAHLVFRWD